MVRFTLEEKARAAAAAITQENNRAYRCKGS
jgi:hypothetical protein